MDLEMKIGMGALEFLHTRASAGTPPAGARPLPEDLVPNVTVAPATRAYTKTFP
jgi:hypothetical protein